MIFFAVKVASLLNPIIKWELSYRVRLNSLLSISALWSTSRLRLWDILYLQYLRDYDDIVHAWLGELVKSNL